MTKILDDHLRCEICDYSARAPSIYNESIATSRTPLNVAIRDGRALCNVCYAAQIDLVEENYDRPLTTPVPHVKIVYDERQVKAYPATHPKLTYYNRMSEELKEKWRTEYVASLMEGCVKFRGEKK